MLFWLLGNKFEIYFFELIDLIFTLIEQGVLSCNVLLEPRDLALITLLLLPEFTPQPFILHQKSLPCFVISGLKSILTTIRRLVLFQLKSSAQGECKGRLEGDMFEEIVGVQVRDLGVIVGHLT